MHPDKTRIIDILKGFNLLGFNIRRYKFNYKRNNSRGTGQQDTVLIIKPTQEAIKRLKAKIKQIIDPSKPLESIIRDINPVLRGWAQYYRISYHSTITFQKIAHYV